MRGRPLLLLRGASQESAAAVLLARRAAPGSPSTCQAGGGGGEAGAVWAIITTVKFFDLVSTIVGISAHGLCYHASFHQLVKTLKIQQCSCQIGIQSMTASHIHWTELSGSNFPNQYFSQSSFIITSPFHF